jgi:hypothetical protein
VCAQIGDNTAGLKNTVQQSRHDIRLESRFAGGTFRLPGYMVGTTSNDAISAFASTSSTAASASAVRRCGRRPTTSMF